MLYGERNLAFSLIYFGNLLIKVSGMLKMEGVEGKVVLN